MASVTAAESMPAFTSPDEAGPDFAIQGEYVGKVDGIHPIGAQVMGLGEGIFQGILYSGGLPGAGWNGVTVFHLSGSKRGQVAKFQGVFGERLQFPRHDLQGTIRDGQFEGSAGVFHNLVKDVSFRLRKVHRKSPTLGTEPPSDAIVLFDGTNSDEWIDGEIVEGELLKYGTTSKRHFGSMRLHLEFRCPYMPTARGMQRGNSGVYLKNEWEIQVVDSFGWHHENRKFERLSTYARCGGIHKMVSPRVNMAFPPLSWQTYDVEFVMAKLDKSGRKIAPAMISVRHNGEVIHDRYVLPTVPPERDPSQSKEGQPGPIYLQDHGNPVVFRNIWVVPVEQTFPSD